ncbi:MAG: hypothetical protein LBT41_05800 [Candidatus Methanoplasma sp.]|jgi:hypothetical protein|nr:hypothetical protein [Candidatus Methanoplasma sp.]
MWSILGADALYIDIPSVTKARLSELAGGGEKEDLFRSFLDRSEIMFLINGSTEECSFFITVPEELTPDDIQLMADVILKVASSDHRFVAVKDAEQRYKIIINNNREPELLGLNKTPGMSSVEVFKPIFRALDSPGRLNNQFEI